MSAQEENELNQKDLGETNFKLPRALEEIFAIME